MQNLADESEVESFLAPPPSGSPNDAPTEIATPDEIDSFIKEEKYGSTGQQIAAGLEGAANAATFGLSTGLERLAGVPAEDIQARREVNPGTHMAGQAAGLIGSAFIPGLGAANIMERAGVAGAKALGLGAAEGALAKIGSGAVKAGIENSVFQGGDEVAKMLASDPGQSIDTVATNIGLSGLLGGAFGGGIASVSPLWKATVGGKVGQLLEAVKTKAGGIDGQISDEVHNALNATGMTASPEVRAGLSNDPQIQSMFKTLEQSDTTRSGRALQESVGKFKKQGSDIMVSTLGKTPEELAGMSELSKYESGKSVGNALADEVESKISPLSKEFDDLKTKHSDLELDPDTFVEKPYVDPNDLSGIPKVEKEPIPGTVSKISEQIGKLADEQGWTASPSSDIMTEVNRIMRELPKQKTLKDLGNYITQIGNNTNKDLMNAPLRRAGQLINNVLKDAEGDLIVKKLGQEGPELVERYQGARSAWRDASKLRDALDDRLHIGGSTSAYAKNLRTMAQTDGETLLRRLSGVGDADALKLLQESFPSTAEALKKYHIDSVIKNAVDKAKPGQEINPKALLAGIEKMSPELREFTFAPGQLEKLRAVGTVLEQFEKAPHNFSNTARTMDKLFEYVPATAVGMATMIAGGNPVMAGALGALTKYLSKDAPDAMKLAMLKFMGSSQPIESAGFKAMVDMVQNTIKGEALINKASRSIFKSEREVLPSKMLPGESERQKLDKTIKKLQADNSPLLDVGGQVGHYMPEHAIAIGQASMAAVNYLNSIRPNVEKKSPLDTPRKPNPVEEAVYNRALDIAEQPLVVLQSVKDGTVTSKDILSLKTMYPGLYNRLSQKITDQMIDHTSKEETIPYNTRLGLAVFLGQDLDSTMTPQGILAAQPKPDQAPPPSQQGPQSKGSMKNINSIGKLAATPEQTRELSRLKKA